MAYKTYQGISKMAGVLSKRIKAEGKLPVMLDFGGIGEDYSLTTNTFPVPIPCDNYSICRNISGITVKTIGGEHGGHNEGNGSHKHEVSLAKLSPGDRVLVLWVQNEPVIVDVILKGVSIKGDV